MHPARQYFGQPVSLKTAAIAIAAGIAALFIQITYFSPLKVSDPVAHTVDAGDLVMSARSNPPAAHVKYKDQTIAVTGKLAGISMQGNKPVITVGYMIAFNVECHLPANKTEQVSRLQIGSSMRVVGVARVSGSSVHLSPCIY